MIFKIADFEQYTRDAPQYIDGLIFVQSGIEKEDTSCLLMWLRRLCKSTEGLSFMLITSSHDSKRKTERKIIRSGKVGRPKTVMTGKKAEKHVHGLIVNENNETEIDAVKKELGSYCIKRRKKRPNLKRQKIQELNGMAIIPYMYRQSDSEHQYGTFDFDYFKDIRFCDYAEDNYDNILDF